mmetsp:Transcript_1442/g.5920  ORF Transcript_1442/g.5920 Transcript_1442/m.5920 type:complete len:355 (-) Transcript_1442:472-1536(-)
MGDATGGRGEELRLAGGFTPPVSAGGCSSSGLSSPARMHACAQSGDTSLAAGFQCRYVVDVVNTCVTCGSFTSFATAPPLSVILSPRMPRRVLLTSGAKYATTGEKNRFGSPPLAAAAGGSRSGFTDAAPPSTPRLDAAATMSASLRYGDLDDSGFKTPASSPRWISPPGGSPPSARAASASFLLSASSTSSSSCSKSYVSPPTLTPPSLSTSTSAKEDAAASTSCVGNARLGFASVCVCVHGCASRSPARRDAGRPRTSVFAVAWVPNCWIGRSWVALGSRVSRRRLLRRGGEAEGMLAQSSCASRFGRRLLFSSIFFTDVHLAGYSASLFSSLPALLSSESEPEVTSLAPSE